MNKYQEALNKVYELISDLDFGSQLKCAEQLKIIQELVDKATPKKPVIRGLSASTHTFIHTCPVCNKELIATNEEMVIYKTKTNYCDNCGQKLDWSKEDE